jgi:PEGA domain
MMSRSWKLPLIALLALLVIVPVASAGPRIFIRGGFGPAFYGPGFYGWYYPWWYGPGYYWGPEGYYYGPGAQTGSVKIETKAKDALVYVDGAYAGQLKDLKTFHLKTGEHDIELRDPSGHTYYQEHVNILPGKTLDLRPNAPAANTSNPSGTPNR